MPTLPDGPPHRFPFRLIDRVGSGQLDGHVTVVLSAGAFYGRGSAWSVALVAEVLAQAIAVLHRCQDSGRVRLAALKGVRLRQEVSPGDRLHIHIHEEMRMGSLRRFSCRALRAGALVAEASVSVAG